MPAARGRVAGLGCRDVVAWWSPCICAVACRRRYQRRRGPILLRSHWCAGATLGLKIAAMQKSFCFRWRAGIFFTATVTGRLDSCPEAVCGSCEMRELEGSPEHRDLVLTDAERASKKTMIICCSGRGQRRRRWSWISRECRAGVLPSK